MLIHELVILFFPKYRPVIGEMGPFSSDLLSERLVVGVYCRKPKPFGIERHESLVSHKEGMLLRVVMQPGGEELIPAFKPFWESFHFVCGDFLQPKSFSA